MKGRKINIAIYSGTIPSSTFIEQLILSVSLHHNVLLFGRKPRKTLNSNLKENISVYSYRNSKVLNVLFTGFRTMLLSIFYPKRLKLLLTQIKRQNSGYKKRQFWFKATPVLLYLPDIFHIQWAKETVNWIFLQELGVKVVVSLRGAHINYSPISDKTLANSYQKYFPKVDAFHAVSGAIAVEAQKYGADPKKIKLIHSLVPQTTFNRFSLPSEKKEEVINILSVGRHHWKKGYTTALDACKLLKDKGISFRYSIIASSRMPEELFFQIYQLELVDEVNFISGLPQEEVFEKMHESDVLLLPSYEEGIANVVLEAMALGLPVISSDCGGMKEVVIHEETGFIVPVLGAKDIASVLMSFEKMALNGKIELVKNANKLIVSKFNEAQGVEKFNQFYESIL